MGYFAFTKKPTTINQQTNSVPEVQNQVPVSTVQPKVNPQINQTTNIPVTQPVGSPSITVISPNGGEVYSRGQNIQIKWSVTNTNDIVRLLLVPGDIQITSFGNAAANLTSPYSWTIPSGITPGTYKIKANAYDQGGSVPTLRGFDTSDNYFTIKTQ